MSDFLSGGETTYSQQVPGQLVPLRPTEQEIRMVRDFPNDSELLHEWIGTEGGSLQVETPADERLAADPAWRQGRVVGPEGETIKTFAYRAELPGPVSKAFFSALGWVAGSHLPARGWLAGKAEYPETES
ncbi:MAG: hypothetical protein ABWY71_01455 [Candidatus Saccharimonadales bacterium]